MDCLGCGTPLTGSVVRCIPCAEEGVRKWVIARDIERARVAAAKAEAQNRKELKNRMTKHKKVQKV